MTSWPRRSYREGKRLGEVMGLFSKKQWQAPAGVPIGEAGVPLGIPAGTTLRESNQVEYLWCDKVEHESLDAQLFYPVELINNGNSVAVKMSGRHVANVAPRALGTAVDALRLSGGNKATGMLEPGDPDRKTSRILVRVA